MNFPFQSPTAQGENPDRLPSHIDEQAIYAADFSEDWDPTEHYELMSEVFGTPSESITDYTEAPAGTVIREPLQPLSWLEKLYLKASLAIEVGNHPHLI